MDAENELAVDTITRTERERAGLQPRSLLLQDWPRVLAILIGVCIATAVSVAWVDLPLAKFILGKLGSGPTQFVVQAQYPDLLDVFVAVVTVCSWVAYVILRRHHTGTRFVCWLQVIGTAVPLSYTAKDLLKAVFGRVNTRYWINHPYHFEFRWLQASDQFFGFPSGHLAVVGAILFAIMHYYPRAKSWCWAAMLLFGAALIVSEYHFLGDVIAGGYVGWLAFAAARELPGTVPSSRSS